MIRNWAKVPPNDPLAVMAPNALATPPRPRAVTQPDLPDRQLRVNVAVLLTNVHHQLSSGAVGLDPSFANLLIRRARAPASRTAGLVSGK